MKSLPNSPMTGTIELLPSSPLLPGERARAIYDVVGLAGWSPDLADHYIEIGLTPSQVARQLSTALKDRH